ncbi:hypothetical protein THMIRHAS_16860 [Thiosulfatimonas sediminis]|uniref:Uncharacterized protein n=1 Tax=Thiosulfatimonas sediminis TaxID=2675054 RepID=A0A6F8PVZ4_9GAMM|nr:hypothetical protein [Thiosulfatimonas sediminis]BBP46313.1 hypothetical protein THMIRHAS_16860 [Thiosulfatimonas sediminis]
MSIKKNLSSAFAGSALAAAAFMVPDMAMAALPAAANIDLGGLVDKDADATKLLQTVFGYLIIIAGVLMVTAAAFFWGKAAVSGMQQLSDENNTKYSMGTWVQHNIIGLLTVGITGVMAFYMYGFGSGLVGTTT